MPTEFKISNIYEVTFAREIVCISIRAKRLTLRNMKEAKKKQKKKKEKDIVHNSFYRKFWS